MVNCRFIDIFIDGARGVLFNVSGGTDLGMWEINEAAKIITGSIDKDAKVIFGAVHDEKLKKGEIKITVIATGFTNGNALRLPLNREGHVEQKKPAGLPQNKSAAVPQEEESEWDAVPAFLRRKGK